MSSRLQLRKSKRRKLERFPICLGKHLSFLQARKSRLHTNFKSHKLSGSSVRFLHLFKFKSSRFSHFPIEGGRLVSPIHFENDTSTSCLQSPIDDGSSITALHSRMEICFKLLNCPIDSGKLSNSLHLSRIRISRLFNSPSLSGSFLSTLFPDPTWPPMMSLLKLFSSETWKGSSNHQNGIFSRPHTALCTLGSVHFATQ